MSCTDSTRYRYNKIISFNKRYLQEHIYKKHNNYVEGKLNLKENQDNLNPLYNVSYEMMVKPRSIHCVAPNSDGNYS